MSEARTALVTGANKGIGLETARQLAAQDITVLLGARDNAKGEAAAKALRQEGGDVQSLVLDVTNPTHHKAVYDQIEKEFGHLDIMVNNAGVAMESSLRRFGGVGQPPSQAPMNEMHTMFEINFFGAVALTQALLPLLRKSKAGRIVNVTSRLASLSVNSTAPTEGWYDEVGYNASKAAMNMFTVLLARELRDMNLKVNATHPGWVRSDMGGPSAPMSVPEGAQTSVWLATLPDDGPTGGFFHQKEHLPW